MARYNHLNHFEAVISFEGGDVELDSTAGMELRLL